MSNIQGYSYVGCYPDSSNRLLDGAKYVEKGSLTIDSCAIYCNSISSNRYYPFIGVENADECYCGTNYTYDPGQENNNACNSPCAGNTEENCGGSGYISVYNATEIPAGITLLSTSSTASAAPTKLSSAASSITPTSAASSVTTTTTPTPSNSQAPSHHASPALIAASVLGGVLALALLIILGMWLLRRGRRRPTFETEFPIYRDQGKATHIMEMPSTN